MPLGVGDDAAVVEIGDAVVAVAVDTLLEGVHFDRALSTWEDVGWKALAVNVSDLAAVASRPRAAVVSLTRPPDLDDAAVVGLYGGLREAADRWELRLVGGDTVTGPTLSLTVTVLGEVSGDGPLRRRGARPGDAVVVVGELGGAAVALALHRAGETALLGAHPRLRRAHTRPEARVAAGVLLARHGATACLDVSDGLGRDLGHLADASQVAIGLDAAALPMVEGVADVAAHLGLDPVELAVGGGDDYALAATVAPAGLDALRDDLAAVGERLTVIGDVSAGSGVVVGSDGRQRDVSELGWQH